MSPPFAPALIVRLPNWVGDVIMSLPALDRLQAAGFTLKLVGKRWAGPLLAGQGWVPAPLPSGTGARIRLLRDLRRDAPPVTSPRRRPDALLLTNSFSSALEARLAGLRPLGYRQDGRGWLLNRALEPPSGGHESARFTRLARALLAARADLGSAPAGLGRSASTIAAADPTGSSGSAAADDADETEEVDKADEADSSGGSARPRLTVAPAAHEAAEALLGRCPVEGQGAPPGSLPGQALPRFACLVPFATGTLKGANKAWPAFPAFAAELARRMPVVVVPGPAEVAQAREHYPACRRLEDVDLGVYAALLARAAVVIANDTGPAHVAAAVGAPLVSVLGPTDASRYRPLGPDVTLVQASPWPTLAEVRSAVERCLDRRPAIERS